MKVIPYNDQYREDVRKICIATGSPDNLVNPEHYNFTLNFYCDPYLELGCSFLLMDDEDQVQGYILCAPDCNEFREVMKPYIAKIHEVSPSFVYRCDLSEYEKFAEEYPAHIHVDILEAHTGKGCGTALFKALLAELEKRKVKGVMLGVDKRNERAYGFYRKMGFEVLEESEFGATLGQKIV